MSLHFDKHLTITSTQTPSHQWQDRVDVSRFLKPFYPGPKTPSSQLFSIMSEITNETFISFYSTAQSFNQSTPALVPPVHRVGIDESPHAVLSWAKELIHPRGLEICPYSPAAQNDVWKAYEKRNRKKIKPLKKSKMKDWKTPTRGTNYMFIQSNNVIV